MSWQPISESKIWDKIICAESEMNPAQLRLWEVIKITPVKWQQSPYGNLGGGFWVVAILGQFVIWFNDIEDGFNVSSYEQYGFIKEYWCNQDELDLAVQSLLNCIQYGYSLPKCSAPIAGEYKDSIAKS
ncbi:hypothetical protein [Andreprevotia chitinilytica]|uniref:hypothetical protein n=1 Tax=Andreprevotia chitinilytica TaxID=396808 RepID=UPI000550C237|nr:hypothetical protein [Andreprevotia chitinilytica]